MCDPGGCDPGGASLPLSAAQAGIWLGQQLDPSNPAYNTAECIEILGAIDPAAFERAVRLAVGEAEALHARFVIEGDEPRQVLSPSTDWAMPVIDLSAAPDPWQAAHAWMTADLGKAIDLSQGPLFAQALFKAADERWFWYQRIHHIAMDGFGYSLLARRVADLYSALVEDRPCEGPSFAPLRAVIDEDRDYGASGKFTSAREFWLERSAGWPEPVSLTSRKAPFGAGFIRSTAHLPQAGLEAMMAAAAKAAVQWPEALTAVTAAFLHRETGSPDIVLGMPVMGRLGSASLRVPCMVMNIVPLRLSVDPGLSLFKLMTQVAEEVRRTRPHQRYRHEQIRRDWKLLNGERRLFGPVVNIMPFDYHLRFAGHAAIAHNLSAGPVEDLCIAAYSRCDGNGLRIDFDANPACYDAATLADCQNRFLDFLTASIGSPDRAIGHGAPAPALPKCVVLDGGPLPRPAHAVTDLIMAQVRARPDAVALIHGDRSMTYGQLADQAGRIAACLIEKGTAPGQLVALLLPRGTDAVTAILGTLFAGAAWLPLDPEGPEARISAILGDAKPSLLITLERHAGLAVVDEGGPEILLLDGAVPVHDPVPPVAAQDTDPAYVIYTSGSTGQPNGVVIGRGALAHFVAGATARYGIEANDRVLQFAPLHFDACVEEIFLTLCAGAALVVRTDDMVQSLPRFLEAVARHGITVLDLPTAFWQELAYAISSDTASGLPPAVRTVIIGGEAALPEPILRWMRAADPSVTLFNTYGPTETTIVATTAIISGTDGAGPNGEEVPIGLPLPGMRAAILGETGELHLIGDALALGYLGRPELTAKRFVTLALPDENVRAYRTGDLVRLRADGQIVFIGRADDEFKISGHRVAPREIETALLRCAGIREAAVIGCVLPGGVKRLSAWLVADEPRPTPADLRRQLQTALPASVIPSDLRFLDRLPRNRNGKIDRAALQRMPVTQAPEPPPAASPIESEILAVWREVLGMGELSVQDDFFDLGGQSLQAIQAVNRLGVRIGREISIATLFLHPTAMGLAGFLERESPADGQGLGVLLPMADRGDRPPLFCVHPAGGLGWCYLGLTRILPDQPLYGLQARGLEAAEPLPSSLEEMAADYLDQIRRVQPTGPYHILGWSVGGAIAHAMAAMLQAAGEEVALLAMLDAYPGDQWRHLDAPGEQDALTALLDVAGHDRAAHRDGTLDRAGVMALLSRAGGPLASLDPARLAALIDIATNNIRLLRQCRHGVFRGDVLFFTAAKPRAENWLTRDSWSAYVEGRIENVDIDCTHPTMLHPSSLAVIGPILRSRLPLR